MSIIEDNEGNAHEVYCTIGEHFVDMIVRADDAQTFDTAALARKVLIQEADGSIRAAKGMHIDRIGRVVITPGEYDETGAEVVAPVLDERYHVNIRITEPALSDSSDGEMEDWKATVLLWSRYGVPDAVVNHHESARIISGVALIDPATISSPSREWL